MPRGRVKREKKKALRHTRQAIGYLNPREHYVYCSIPITVEELARTWEGYKGCALSTLTKRCAKEGWKGKRKEYELTAQREAEKKILERQSDERSRDIEEASKRHADLGKDMQQLGRGFGETATVLLTGKMKCPHCKGEIDIPAPDVKSTDAGRTFARLGKDGIDAERKALGVADRFEVVSRTEEVVTFVFELMSIFITDTDTFRAMGERLTQFSDRQRKEMDLEVKPVIDAKFREK